MPHSPRRQTTYFPYVSSGPGTAEFLPPLLTLHPSPRAASRASTREMSDGLNSTTAPPRSHTHRTHHAHSLSFSPSASASASPVTTTTSVHSQSHSPAPKPRIPRSASNATSLSWPVSPATTSPSSTATVMSPSSMNMMVLTSSSIPQHPPSSAPLSKDEKLRRRASQPVLVRAYHPNTSPSKQTKHGGSLRTGIYGSVAGSGGVHDRVELAPVQYPAAGMFTVHALFGSIGCSLPQFYEAAFDLVEVCDAYFHIPGHLSPEAVFGRGS
ncbi:hypothetical protein POJ06DRAFT_249876 [Lipomyces tetrasporus]|uniref:Uncharacterized protein n=1 Tax=Lipomyces tetrasporus TaxID=54092 RepID=A0AAD7QTB6_9ASCO|nr:uncharacterized protein POJ06DRAFT_249876 [Lipomyces tetrasporus]KAJ8100923.1 hypothetical protein POJ06DRAFT_249876 [Lipomyces tetrasporus]